MRPRQSGCACYVRASTHNFSGFDDGLADVFDPLLDAAPRDAYQMPGYGSRQKTTDGQEPLCGELIAWRHPTFGNYTDEELAYSFVHAHDSRYSRHSFTSFECLTWLLSDNADIGCRHLRNILLGGMRSRTYLGWATDIMYLKNAFSDALFHRTRRKFNLSRKVRSALVELFAAALQKLCEGLSLCVRAGQM